MSKKVNVRLSKEVFEDIKSKVEFENVSIEKDTVFADVNELKLNIALHQAGWTQNSDMEYVHKLFNKTIEQLNEFRTLLDNEYVVAMLTELDVEMFVRDSESLASDIKDVLHLFEF